MRKSNLSCELEMGFSSILDLGSIHFHEKLFRERIKNGTLMKRVPKPYMLILVGTEDPSKIL